MDVTQPSEFRPPYRGITTIVGERRLLSEIAERLLGSEQDAEEVVRETYAHWFAMPEDLQDEVGWPAAWLAGVAGHLCLERLNGAHMKAPLPAGPRHPEERASRSGPVAPRAPAHRHDRMVTTFKQACERMEPVDELTALLASDVAVITDSGGRVRAPLQPIVGAERAARFILALLGGQAGVTLVEASINGGPGIVVRIAGSTAAVVALHIGDDRIQDVWITMNPDKLRAWQEREDPPPGTARIP